MTVPSYPPGGMAHGQNRQKRRLQKKKANKKKLSGLHKTWLNGVPEMQSMHLHHNAKMLLP